jgi:hypothetical protein
VIEWDKPMKLPNNFVIDSGNNLVVDSKNRRLEAEKHKVTMKLIQGSDVE